MSKFVLPEGYSFEPPPEVSIQGVTVPGFSLYGGADVSMAYDAAGNHYVGCNAKGPGDPPFRWRLFWKRKGASTYEEVPLPFLSTGRGEISLQMIDGALHAIAWEGNAFNYDIVAGFEGFESLPSVSLRLNQIETALGNGDSIPSHPEGQPVVITKESPLGQLYSGVPPYDASHFDTPAETAARVQKQLMALHQLVDILWRQGLVVKL